MPFNLKADFLKFDGFWSGESNLLLVFQVKESCLRCLIYEKNKLKNDISFPLTELTKERFLLSSNLKPQDIKKSKIILVLNREEMIQKELIVDNQESSDLEKWIDKKIEKIFPYSREEIVSDYFSRKEESSIKLTLFAVPLQNLEKTINFFEKINLKPNEIINEEELVFCPLKALGSAKNGLYLERRKKSVFLVLIKSGGVAYSQVFSVGKGLAELLGGIQELLNKHEISSSKVFISGWNEDEKALLKKRFSNLIELPEKENTEELRFLRDGKHLSFLPKKEREIQKRNKDRKRFFELGKITLYLALVILLAFLFHVQFQKEKTEKIKSENMSLVPKFKKIKTIQNNLSLIYAAQESKSLLLSFLKKLTEVMPREIELNRLEVEGDNFFLLAESPSHAVLNKALGELEKIEGVSDLKLGHTRLRRKLDNDYLEFEIKGVWGK